MRLVNLNPAWFSTGGPGEFVAATGEPAPLRERIGVAFDCPCGCDCRCAVTFSNPPDGGPMVEGRGWARSGDTFETLTLSPSIQRVTGCPKQWHGFVTAGEVTTC